MTETRPTDARGRAAFAHRDFRLYLGARVLATLGLQMQSVAVGWQIYDLTRDPLYLGWVGLAQFLPLVLLALVAGQVADRWQRRRIVLGSLLLFALGSAALALLAARREPGLAAIYLVLVALGTGRAFNGPANAALLAEIVPACDFPNAVAWSSSGWQLATVAGPALGGLCYGTFGPTKVYAAAAGLLLAAAALASALSARGSAASRARQAADAVPRAARAAAGSAAGGREPTGRAVLGGLGFIWRHKVILGSISLDLFAVLLGGAVALLPALARDVLHVGPWGLGLLRGAPALGAALMGLTLAYRPLERRAGRVMLMAVGVFGLGTIMLGASHSFLLSLGCLVVLGAADMISVIVRQNLVQLGTPDAMRGRVSAVNLVFIGASNELGEFESGVTAAWLGVRTAVVIGGIGTCAVVLLWALLFPRLRRVDRLSDAAEDPDSGAR